MTSLTRTTLLALALALTVGTTAKAQTPAPATPPDDDRPKYKPYGSPLDTILSTRLWTSVPEQQEFVRETRPDPKTLKYVPLVGKDPERTKPRDAAGVEALRAELQQGMAKNADAMKNFEVKPPAPPAPPLKKSAAKKKPAAKKAAAK